MHWNCIYDLPCLYAVPICAVYGQFVLVFLDLLRGLTKESQPVRFCDKDTFTVQVHIFNPNATGDKGGGGYLANQDIF